MQYKFLARARATVRSAWDFVQIWTPLPQSLPLNVAADLMVRRYGSSRLCRASEGTLMSLYDTSTNDWPHYFAHHIGSNVPVFIHRGDPIPPAQNAWLTTASRLNDRPLYGGAKVSRRSLWRYIGIADELCVSLRDTGQGDATWPRDTTKPDFWAGKDKAKFLFAPGDDKELVVHNPFHIDKKTIPAGVVYNWKCRFVTGHERKADMADYRRAGWKAVPPKRHPALPKGPGNRTIEVEGMILMEIDKKTHAAMQAEDYEIAMRQVGAVIPMHESKINRVKEGN